jgi:aldehyde dehydrogenase (NAD+)
VPGFLFSRDQKAIDHFLASLAFGGGAINHVNVHLSVGSIPFGGVGYSGIGHYYGKDCLDALTHAKSILVSRPDVAIEHLFPPYRPEKVQELNQWFELPLAKIQGAHDGASEKGFPRPKASAHRRCRL